MSHGLVIHHRNVLTNVKDRARQTDSGRDRERQRERDALMLWWFVDFGLKIALSKKGDKVNEF